MGEEKMCIRDRVVNAEGLQNCKKMLQMAKLGKYNGYLLEGMACPGGCVAGAGTIQTIQKASAALDKMCIRDRDDP